MIKHILKKKKNKLMKTKANLKKKRLFKNKKNSQYPMMKSNNKNSKNFKNWKIII